MLLPATQDLASAADRQGATPGDDLWAATLAGRLMRQYPVLTAACGCDLGLLLQGFEQVWSATGDGQYLDYMRRALDQIVEPDGTLRGYRAREYNLEDLSLGRALLRLYQERCTVSSGASRYRQSLELLRKQLRRQPRTSEGGFWHSKSRPFQMWLSDVYRAGPFYAGYGKTFGERAAFDDVAHQILLIERHTRDPQTGLFYRAWDESKMQDWANPQTGCAPHFSARAMGWYAMAIVDVLDDLPASHQARDRIITILARMMHSLTLAQDPATGLWRQELDETGRDASQPDVSAACMFVYAIAEGFRMGLLDATHLAAAYKAYAGLLERLAACDELGALLLASLELQRAQASLAG